jgi:pyrroline-5-carboxylate reductase
MPATTLTAKIGVIGGNGWLGSAIVQALIDGGTAKPEQFVLSYRSGQPDRFAGALWTRDNQELADKADVILVSVRPQDWPTLGITAHGKLAISVMAGISLDGLKAGLGTERVVRTLPNAAAEVRRSFTPWIASTPVSDEERALVRRIFEACGTSAEVATEAQLDYFTGLTGMGPALPALMASAMMHHAVQQGIDPDIARQAVISVLVGTGHLFEKRGDDPDETVKAFLDYRGTTAAAIEAMRAQGFDRIVEAGLAAALEKTILMGK